MSVHEASYGYPAADREYLNGYRIESPTEAQNEGLRPEELFTDEERAQTDIDDVLYYFDRLTTQEKLLPEEETIIAQALIHAIEKVQKNLDNLI
jgi:hypothetical protein